MQIVMTCGQLQVNVAKDNSILRDGPVDLVSREGVFLKSDKILNSSFSLMGELDDIPNKTNPYCAPSLLDQTCFESIIAGKVVDLANVSSKLVYNEFRSLKQTPATAKAKILNKYPDLAIDWKKLYWYAFETTLDTKLREFQCKILNLIVFTNEKLHRFKMVDSPLCAFYNAQVESLEHLLYFCKSSIFFLERTVILDSSGGQYCTKCFTFRYTFWEI